MIELVITGVPESKMLIQGHTHFCGDEQLGIATGFFSTRYEFLRDRQAVAFATNYRVDNDMGKPGGFRVQDQAADSDNAVVVFYFQRQTEASFSVKLKECLDALPPIRL